MKKILLLLAMPWIFMSCSKRSNRTNETSSNLNMIQANFSPNFDFSTSQNLNIDLFDNSGVVFLVYGKYQNEKNLLLSGSVLSGRFRRDINISAHYTSIEIERSFLGEEKAETFDLSPPRTTINEFFRNKRKTINANPDILYGINSAGDFFTIDLSDYSSTMLPTPIKGSIALAVDTLNDKVYYHRHPSMYVYDINSASHSTHATYTTPFNGNYPRMEYNHNDGYLYVAKNSTLHVINADNGNTLSTYNITGIVNSNAGGDLAFPPNGNIYMSCFSGLYELNLSGSTAQATRLSAENFPFQLTSLGYDRHSYLYAGTTASNSNLIKIDPVDGSWVMVKTYNHTINDLGSVSTLFSSLPQNDSDGDGVIDELDAAPLDSAIAHKEFTPSELGNGTLGFEDLWPAKGDYDFNDLVVRYKFIKYLNSHNKMVKLEAQFQVKAIGASLHNGFGIELDIDPSLIESVTGTKLTKNIVSNNSKGLEAGHNGKSVIIVFDDAFDQITHPGGGIFINTEANAPESVGDSIKVTINFTQTVDPSAVGSAPFNPFIFVGGDRGKEIHLANNEPTIKQNLSLFGTVDDNSDPSTGKYYRSENNLPWALDIKYEFRHPLEKKRIDQAYNHFVNWGLSSGSSYPDWYKDNNGFRNTSNLYLK